MVWILVLVLVLLGLGWYVWAQSISSSEYATPVISPTTSSADTSVVPSGQTQVNTDPNGPDYQPSRAATSTTDIPAGTTTPVVQ